MTSNQTEAPNAPRPRCAPPQVDDDTSTVSASVASGVVGSRHLGDEECTQQVFTDPIAAAPKTVDRMSEELLQTTPASIGRYLYHRLGASTVRQLSTAGVISGNPPKGILRKKPDGLIVLGKGTVKAWIEYKTPVELNTSIKINKAIDQAVVPARQLCNILIVSDGQQTHWINPHTGKRVQSGSALPVLEAKAIIDGTATIEYLQSIELLIDQAEHSLNQTNDKLSSPSLIDPSNLAQTIWQKIWINTGKEPEKCLYNVVELFIFKFLSDLAVLGQHNDFSNVCSIGDQFGGQAALESYARMSRPAIRELFPDGQDGTGIINGTIFVNEKGAPNNSQARLFFEVLTDLRKYDEKYGSFRYIDKEFKTRLYESFLRQGAGLHHLGQFFTPRNVVQAIVSMSGADTLPSGATIGDPFCGVGGFILESILQCPRLRACFNPRNGVISPDITFVGYDRGSDEKEDERTIILAKANALIYFSDLIARHNTPEFTREFTDRVINSIFSLVRTNLGSFKIDNAEHYDLILTNPPYVTRGSASLKNAIEEAGISNWYSATGRGTESLALQWIVRSLKRGGTAIAIVPDGLLNQAPMLTFVKERCIIRAVISLPTRTFYATPKKTYILIISRKTGLESENGEAHPVFSYLISEIGETRDANRWPIADNDLNEAVALYNQFKGSPSTFTSPSPRCKVVPWAEFDAYDHWMLDRYCWTSEELQELGMADELPAPVTVEQFNRLLRNIGLRPITPSKNTPLPPKLAEVLLSDEKLFELRIGKRVLKKECVDNGIPCISANVRDVFGYIPESRLIHNFDTPSLTWGIDGNFDWYLIPAGYRFHPTDHCGVLRIQDEDIDAEYLYYALRSTRNRHGFDRTYRANLANVGRVSVEIPVLYDGRFDLEAQRQTAKMFRRIEKKKAKAIEKLQGVAEAQISLL